MDVDQCQHVLVQNGSGNPNIKIWHLSIGISIDIWALKFVIKDAVLKLFSFFNTPHNPLPASFKPYINQMSTLKYS